MVVPWYGVWGGKSQDFLQIPKFKDAQALYVKLIRICQHLSVYLKSTLIISNKVEELRECLENGKQDIRYNGLFLRLCEMDGGG